MMSASPPRYRTLDDFLKGNLCGYSRIQLLQDDKSLVRQRLKVACGADDKSIPLEFFILWSEYKRAKGASWHCQDPALFPQTFFSFFGESNEHLNEKDMSQISAHGLFKGLNNGLDEHMKFMELWKNWSQDAASSLQCHCCGMLDIQKHGLVRKCHADFPICGKANNNPKQWKKALCSNCYQKCNECNLPHCQKAVYTCAAIGCRRKLCWQECGTPPCMQCEAPVCPDHCYECLICLELELNKEYWHGCSRCVRACLMCNKHACIDHVFCCLRCDEWQVCILCLGEQFACQNCGAKINIVADK